MSSEGVFSARTFCGVAHAAARLARLVTQMSIVPTPLGRSEPNQSVSPSAEIAALVSNIAVFTSVSGVGAVNASKMDARRANQTSPLPLTRSLVNTISSKSAVSVGLSVRTSERSSVTIFGASK